VECEVRVRNDSIEVFALMDPLDSWIDASEENRALEVAQLVFDIAEAYARLIEWRITDLAFYLPYSTNDEALRQESKQEIDRIVEWYQAGCEQAVSICLHDVLFPGRDSIARWRGLVDVWLDGNEHMIPVYWYIPTNNPISDCPGG